MASLTELALGLLKENLKAGKLGSLRGQWLGNRIRRPGLFLPSSIRLSCFGDDEEKEIARYVAGSFASVLPLCPLACFFVGLWGQVELAVTLSR